jgi:heme-degrading monooxygenase HmoA
MSEIADTPKPPYYTVIFTSIRTESENGYAETSARMVELAEQHDGYLGIESARDGLGITVSYWKDLASIKAWKANAEHIEAQKNGRSLWYSNFKIRIAKIERDYGMGV